MASRLGGRAGGSSPWAGARTGCWSSDTRPIVCHRGASGAAPQRTLSRDGSIAWVGSQQQGATALGPAGSEAGKETARVALDKTPRGSR